MKTAAFIGTFDPLHGAHIGQLLRAHHFMSLSKVYILINKHPSHKPNASSWQHRAKMARLTLESFNLPFDHEVIAVENSHALEITQVIDYKITGIDSLSENLSDSKRWDLAQRWPMIVLSIPGVAESSLTNVIATLPKNVQQGVSYTYVNETAAPMMNYNFEDQTFVSYRVHATDLRSGQKNALIPPVVRAYIKTNHLYDKTSSM